MRRDKRETYPVCSLADDCRGTCADPKRSIEGYCSKMLYRSTLDAVPSWDAVPATPRKPGKEQDS